MMRNHRVLFLLYLLVRLTAVLDCRDPGEASVSDDGHVNSRSQTEECPSDNAQIEETRIVKENSDCHTDGCSSSGSGLASVAGKLLRFSFFSLFTCLAAEQCLAVFVTGKIF